jgi:predicted DNA-binding transcriptional regulator YafY
MTSRTYQLFRQAVLNKQQVTCTYQNLRRELCPHALGYTDGREQALSFQFAGQSSKGLPPGGQWRCMKLDDVTDVQLVDGPWHTGTTQGRPQSCVKQVDVEVAYA